MLHQLSKWLLLFGLVLFLTAIWKKDELPSTQQVRTELLEEPTQTVVHEPPFQSTVGEITYDIQPLYQYELYGLVVSRHDTNAWWDYIHKDWNDQLNVADICVVWGDNVRNATYRDIEFSSSQFICYFQTSSDAAYRAFDQTAISNNHLLTADANLARQMRKARIGDQIHFTGYLAEYSHNHGGPFRRGTSTVRTDTGNGACETVYVQDFEILQRGGGPWYTLQWLAVLLLIVGVVAWFAAPAHVKS